MATWPPEERKNVTFSLVISARNSSTLPTPIGMMGFSVAPPDRKSTRLNSSHSQISYAVFCLKKKKKITYIRTPRPQAQHDDIDPSHSYQLSLTSISSTQA